MLRRSLATLSALFLSGFFGGAEAQTWVVYRAETAGAVQLQGSVFAAKVEWDCAASSCVAKAPDQLNQLEMCRDLARQVGPLKAYQYGDTMMDAQQLQQCNSGDVSANQQSSDAKSDSKAVDSQNAEAAKLEAHQAEAREVEKQEAASKVDQHTTKGVPLEARPSVPMKVSVGKQSRDALFKTPEYWKQAYAVKLQSAPKETAEAISKVNSELLKGRKSFTVGLTSVYAQPVASVTGFVPPQQPADLPLPEPDMQTMESQANCTTATIRASDARADMRDLGVITRVRNQRRCGGCWAFATLASLETSILLKNGGDASALELSQPQVLGCAWTVPGGCNGGMQAGAAGYANDHPIVTAEAGRSFNEWFDGGQVNRCEAFATISSPYRVRRWNYVTGNVLDSSPNRASIKQAIADHGSVAASLHATPTFLAYAGGVYDMNDNPTLFPNHVVQIIGWDDAAQAWLIKNSWGEDWGEGGFGWVHYDTNVIGAYAVWVEAERTPGNPCATNAPVFRGRDESFSFYQHHRIQSRQSSLLVEINDSLIGGDRGRKVQQYHVHGAGPFIGDARNQTWWFLPGRVVAGRQTYRLFNEGYVNFITDEDGTILSLPGNGGNNQRWFIENAGAPGVFSIVNAQSGKALQVPEGNNLDEAAMTTGVYTGAVHQKFGISSVAASSGIDSRLEAAVTLVPVHATHMALDLNGGNPANGTAFHLWEKQERNENQLVKIVWNDAAKAFNIQSKPGRVKCLAVSEMSREDGAPVEQQDCTSHDSQAWYFIPVARESGRFIILNKFSGKSLDVYGFGTANGTRIVQWEFVNGSNQKWEIRDFR